MQCEAWLIVGADLFFLLIYATKLMRHSLLLICEDQLPMGNIASDVFYEG